MANLIPAGRYLAHAVDAKLGLAGTGSEQIGIGFEIKQEGDYYGWTYTGFFAFTEKAADYTFEKMRNAGWTGDDVTDLSSLCPAAEDCVIIIKHDSYNGEKTAKIASVYKVGDGSVKMNNPLEGAALNHFAARMKAKALASRKETGSGTSSKPGGGGHPNAPGNDFGPPPGSDDDIPF